MNIEFHILTHVVLCQVTNRVKRRRRSVRVVYRVQTETSSRKVNSQVNDITVTLNSKSKEMVVVGAVPEKERTALAVQQLVNGCVVGDLPPVPASIVERANHRGEVHSVDLSGSDETETIVSNILLDLSIERSYL